MAPFDDVNWSRGSWILYGVAMVLLLGFIIFSFLGTFVFGLFIYYATRPFYRRIRRHVRQRTVAATLSLLTLAVPIVLLIAYTAAITLQELGRFSTRADLGPINAAIEPYINVSSIVDNPQSLLEEPGGLETLTQTLTTSLEYLDLIGSGLIHAFVMFALAFYLLRDGYRLKRLTTVVSDEHGVLDTYMNAVDRSLSKVFFGNILNAILTAVIGAISYSVLNVVMNSTLSVPYPALVGVLAGVASLIPIVGMKLVYFPVAGYLAVMASIQGSGWDFLALFLVLSMVVVDAIPDFVLRPYVSGRSLHVGAVMIAYILGPLLFGWYGIFLGPMVLVVLVHFVRIVLPELLAGRPIQPYSVDPGNYADERAVGPAEVVENEESGESTPPGSDPSPTE
jgi:predicted PurR-regulated permease PerM